MVTCNQLPSERHLRPTKILRSREALVTVGKVAIHVDHDEIGVGCNPALECIGASTQVSQLHGSGWAFSPSRCFMLRGGAASARTIVTSSVCAGSEDH